MIEPILQTLEKLVIEFSWRRLFHVFLLFILIVISFWLFDNYTGYFRLARIDKTNKVLRELSEIGDSNLIKTDKRLSKIYKSTISDLEDFTSPKQININSTSFHTALKFILGAIPWLLLGIGSLRSVIKGSKEEVNTLLGCIIFAFIFGLIGAMIPTFEWIWFNYAVYPIVHFFIVASFLILLSRKRQLGNS